MPTFTPPTYNQPINNRLGDFGVSFPVGKIVYITSGDDVVETTAIVDPDTLLLMKAGSGDMGLAFFRRGKTYTITSEEYDLLDGAGYDDYLEV